ncbi:MAG: hypothetical protein M3372_07010 [Verrucomicrobiota bacterium]|nr:hypothetical protein [Verrucomicrobiota bacterium]
MNNDIESKELSSLEGTRGQFNVRTGAIKLGIDVHQAFYFVVVQEGGSHPKPAQRMSRGGVSPLGGEAAAESFRSGAPRGL